MSTSQYSSPLKIDLSIESPQVEVMERVSISSREGGFNEAFIQDLVFRYPTSLPIDQIDRTFAPLIPVCCELNTPAGPLDVLYVTPEGRLVILEAKLWRNPESRRKVVAQILDYAKELRKWDYEDLQREVSRATGEKGNVLYNLVKGVNSNISESEFVDEVSRSLSSGRFLLLIVGDGIREGAAAITDFLSDVGNMEFTFGLVELAIYKAESEQLIVQPRVLAKTVIIQRMVVSLKDNRLEIDNTDDESEVRELKDYEIYYSNFWPEFIDELQLDDTSQPMPNRKLEARRFGNIFFAMPPGGHHAWITVYFEQKTSSVGVFLTFRKGDYSNIAYEKLLADKDEINNDLDIDVEWSSMGGKNRIFISKNFDDLFSQENRGEIKQFFADTVNRFVNSFRPRLQRIVDDL